MYYKKMIAQGAVIATASEAWREAIQLHSKRGCFTAFAMTMSLVISIVRQARLRGLLAVTKLNCFNSLAL